MRGGRLLCVTFAALLFAPAIYMLSLAPLCGAYLDGWVSRDAWLWLTSDPGPYAPAVEWSVHGDGAAWELHRQWLEWWER